MPGRVTWRIIFAEMSRKNIPILEDRVFEFICTRNLIKPGNRVLMAVSGGPDSVALAHILYNLRKALDVSLVIAHLDHGLREDESAADALFVADFAQQLGLPFSIGGRDVAGYRSKHRLGLEEAAREVRYRFLSEVAAETGADLVATGHTRSDNVETILMHLIRGSGTLGLKGLPVKTTRHEYNGVQIEIIRPLLGISRDEVKAYLSERNIPSRQDSTNQELSPLRNRIRLELLPMIKNYNPAADEALLRLADIASEELDYLARARDAEWEKVASRADDCVILEKNPFKALHPAVRRSILRRALEEIAGSLKDFEAGHIEDILAHLDKPAGRQVVLPGGITFTVEYSRYLLGKDPEKLCPYPELEGEVALKIPGKSIAGGWKIKTEVLEGGKMPEGAGAFKACFDYDKTGKSLVLRERRPGDRFIPLGMKGEKKVKDYLIDAKVPRLWRNRIPLIESGGHIIWVVGHRIDDRVKITPQTRKVLCIEMETGRAQDEHRP